MLASAIGWNRAPEKAIFSLIESGYAFLFTAEHLAEIERVLEYPHIPVTKERKERILIGVLSLSKQVAVPGALQLVSDPVDNILLETAARYHATVLITGDKELLMLKRYRQTRICSPSEFLTRTDRYPY